MQKPPTPKDVPPGPAPPGLRRVLTFWPLVLYGLGVIVGAGIYVATGAVIARAGDLAPLSFLLAGLAAGLTGLCYAELASRLPEASGSVGFVREAFQSRRLAQLSGAVLAVTVAISAGSIVHGSVLYMQQIVALPAGFLAAGLVVLFTAVALLGVRESVGLAALMSVVEIAGLLAAIAAGMARLRLDQVARLVAVTPGGMSAALSGAFIAFFAFLGFETLANLAEEVRQPQRTLPRGILGAIGASLVLYVAVASAAVLGGGEGRHPLIGLFAGRNAIAFALLGTVAVANGVLVQIVMLSRLFYGMARQGQLPALLGRVSRRTDTPGPATLLAGAIVLAVVLAVPFEPLLVWTNLLTLGLFVLVDLALWRLHRRGPTPAGAFAAPRWVPPLAAAAALLLIGAQILA
ncbi:MAG: amino acid permease [Rhodospirillales bacterium]|nr:amino acid permease [Rhodospirillales bacterium]